MNRTLFVVTAVCLAAVALAGCGLPPGADQRHLWTTADFTTHRDAGGETWGWHPAELISAEEQLQALPAFSAGKSVAFVITELWYDSPNPWVQPAYMNPTHPEGATVFPVDVGGSFYSPFWQASVYRNDGAQLTNSKQVLDTQALTFGDLIVCPIVPAQTTVATEHPWTGRALVQPALKDAYVDDHLVKYLAFGLDRVRGAVDRVNEAKVYVFVGADGQSLGLPEVLEDDVLHRSFARRYEVHLPATAKAFWPSGYNPRTLGREADWQTLGPRDPSLVGPSTRPYLLRVASNGECLTADAGFPSSCHWLDSISAVDTALPPSAIVRTEVTATATLLPEAP